MSLKTQYRVLPICIAACVIVAMLLHGPILQPDHYHEFADQRTLFGIANGADVLSNLGFLAVGLFGLLHALRSRDCRALDPVRAPYALFFISLLMTAASSSWYHLEPDNARLVWDRLPIALACAALLAVALREAFRPRWPTLGMLFVASVGSVFWWRMTDLQGAGDLRPYLLFQILPLILIPLMQWQAGVASAERRAFGLAIALYILAKLCEIEDHAILGALGLVSGHTLKHLFATFAALVLARSFARQRLTVHHH